MPLRAGWMGCPSGPISQGSALAELVKSCAVGRRESDQRLAERGQAGRWGAGWEGGGRCGPGGTHVQDHKRQDGRQVNGAAQRGDQTAEEVEVGVAQRTASRGSGGLPSALAAVPFHQSAAQDIQAGGGGGHLRGPIRNIGGWGNHVRIRRPISAVLYRLLQKGGEGGQGGSLGGHIPSAAGRRRLPDKPCDMVNDTCPSTLTSGTFNDQSCG